MEPWEAELKSWKPRRPSASISRRLFPARSGRQEFARTLSWLATAAACLTFTVVVASRTDRAGASPEGSLVAMNWSNQAPPSYQMADTFQSENRVIRATFAWTNPSHSNSSVGFMQKSSSAD